ncbi:NAD(P)H-hydrate dehydratase [Roseovarius rhodophyticola]|uniref:ADP-dependent (S)-NAD(P)H-hydrate dehydratase n=1 Tax=Roseovarius rhodophyticola TaxID=3080827 RepID=A0ABZ2TFQ3_9RHOB|nr:NAD(P)H-hydrate dehydratase [Roseovarius sp. W115]MDV2928784.1 NAD(P)H-hydrate dehydratase [Roseovarius sp. W115]
MYREARVVSGSTAMKEALRKSSSSHKYTHGHALILSGGPGHTGAARLGARGALRIGAGLVTLGVPPAAQQEVASQITAIMLKQVKDAAALANVLQDDRLNALCLGPGLGVERAKDLVPQALSVPAPEPGRPGKPRDPGSGPGLRSVVLDADALTAYTDNPETLFAMLHQRCVLTPHAGEFARLFPDIAEKLKAPATKGPAYSKVDATREAAARAGCVVLFKGPDTVIAAPDGRCSINSAQYDRAAPWLATAGSGDVLAGFITGLLARGLAPMQAAEIAIWLHVECALSFGPGLIAEDLPEELPKVFRALGV